MNIMNPNSRITVDLDRTPSQTPAPDPSAPRWGHLQILAKVGTGSFGEVHRAWDTVLHRQVALKLLPKGSSEDLLAEARTLAGIDDPHVIRVLGAEVHDGKPGLWMDFVEGENLETRIRESGRLSLKETVAYGHQLATALTTVHATGLLHRDIKPANIMERPDGSVVLMDLGTGKPRAEVGTARAGTPNFMAPEVLSGGPESPRSDLYSLGAVLFNLVTGELPVTGTSLVELEWAHSSGSTADLNELRPGLPRGFRDLVAKALSTKPTDRFENADELAAALSGVLAQLGTVSRTRSFAGIMVAAAVVLAGYFGFQILGSGTSGSTPLDGRIDYVGYHLGIEQDLGNGDAISPGDRLGINLELSSPAFVYILNLDESGAVTVMYPLAGGRNDRLDASERHYLPGTKDDQRLGWTFNTMAGLESFVVVASRERLEEFEQQLASLPTVDVGGGLTVRSAGPPVIASLMRGISGLAGISLLEAKADNAELAQFFSFFATTGSNSTPGRIWVHEMKLSNSGL